MNEWKKNENAICIQSVGHTVGQRAGFSDMGVRALWESYFGGAV